MAYTIKEFDIWAQRVGVDVNALISQLRDALATIERVQALPDKWRKEADGRPMWKEVHFAITQCADELDELTDEH